MLKNQQINVIERDICLDIVNKEYDLIIAHLLLGEATKFGNSYEVLLDKVCNINSRYIIIIDYLEDPKVNEKSILEICNKYNWTIIYKSYFKNDIPQVWNDFVGDHNFGYLIKKK
ncbi:hypothetical protein Ana3638_21180 [Anaerocolumna sedimenticola]|uniref:Uncharacterized protein n=1 Tax=Anaerocolumna sedimenticola TaxID=2696063 RepID=A0A6P1TU76_9FIRM|nr:hypothetical protein [Anaerocolumna sedimenticola]QHQ62985.1 hypothetical protein Ana3638_21180 [Anaerocolumna sedimenticola]